METRIVKLEKGVFMIEYRDKRTQFAKWITLDKQFKTKTKAEEYLATHPIS